jgi:CPA1 family monovalent cation:H+ antiporter
VLLIFTILLVFILLSRIIENIIKVPSTLSLIVLSFLLSYFFPTIINLSDDKFDDILYLMLPIVLLPDILNISVDELKKHYKEVIYLAFFAVIISIIIAVFITPFLLPEYQFTLGMLIALFSMLMATDAITVSSIMSKFRLPEKLKIYAESESLFNDVTSLIIFYFIAIPMINGSAITLIEINETLIKVLFLSTLIGILVAYTGYYTIKILQNSFDQLLVIYLIVSVSFMTAEYFEIAGILSIVTSVLTFRYLVKKEFLLRSKQKPFLTEKNFGEYKKESEFIGIVANAIVFIILANIINVSLLFDYLQEIIIIFILTTIIRFSLIASMTIRLKLPFKWAKALTYAGAKGALAIIMVHSLSDTFIYKDMFTAVIIGNVLLSTFIYTIMLIFHISKNKLFYKCNIDKNM